MSAIFKKELKTYFTSLTTFLYYAFFFLALGIYFSVYCLSNYNTQFGYYVLAKAFFVCVLMIPFFTMRIFAQEKRRKTDQLLYTAPISGTEIFMGKYFAILITLFLPILFSVIFPLILSNYGEVNIRFVVCSYIGVCLIELAAISVGVFFSTITANMFLAAIFTYICYFLFVLLRIVENISGDGKLYYFLHSISPYNLYNDMISGIVKSGDIVYLIMVSGIFLFFAWLNVNRKYMNCGKKYIYVSAGVIVFACVSFFAFNNSKVYDYTPEKILTLSDETKEIVSKVDNETYVYYMGRISNANATYKEFLNLYEQLNENIKVYYKEIDNDMNFQLKYLKDISMINDASLLVVCGDSYIYLDSGDYINTVQVTDYSYKSLLTIEEQLTSAIYHVNQDDKYKIYCAEGHGEEAVSGKIRNYISMNGYEIKYINFADKLLSLDATIPDDCSLILVNAPESDYSTDEINALREYVDGGGSIAFMLDPLNEDTDNLYAYFEECGMKVVSGIVIEKDPTRYAYDTVYSLAPRLKEHDITESLIDQGLYVYTMTSKGIEVKDLGEHRTDLLLTSAKSFSKISDYDNISVKNDGDIGGPFSVASLYEKNNGKIFLITSNLFMDEDTDKDTLGGNHSFLINVIDYLSGIEDNIHIEGKNVSFNTALYHNSKIKMIRFLVIGVIPALIVLVGILVAVLRTKNIIVMLKEKKDKNFVNEDEKE